MTTTWHTVPTWGDFLGDFFALRTGYPIYTMTALAAYLVGVTLLLPGNVRIWGGILREIVLTFYDMARWLIYAVGYLADMAELAAVRAQIWAAGRPRQRTTLPEPAALLWAHGDALPSHPARVACANPTMCPDCRAYL